AVNKETSQGSTSFIVVLWPLFKYADDSTIISSVDNKYNSFVSLVERFLTWFKEKKMSYIPCECTEQIWWGQCQRSNHNKDRKCCIESDRDSDSDREGHIDSHEDRDSYRDKDSKGANENETSNDKDNEKDSD
ncbi:hypothetical protein pdam_00013212, partial [Pocillopora damicornis]